MLYFYRFLTKKLTEHTYFKSIIVLSLWDNEKAHYIKFIRKKYTKCNGHTLLNSIYFRH